ncbi:mannose-1-phosphate guanylyltransferase/mannose-6-phosphate isomerase [Oceanibium sediminis]|uniref:mannose-1-phosphate guanylyltransferase/mannose-6-phosphate isomerase n=1 Tax=Oceanibium sediminis TaxID=2026339 RepID=UPI0018E54088|nr:mannose-1-phosphate guanylyltransferase/mannose-6-phosphate isomerase [Oceanibium sediminis]
MNRILPVVLSGGSGSRLWPVSRPSHPKQFLKLHGEQTMLRTTLDRVAPLGDRLTVICAEAQRFLVAEQLRESGHAGRIVLEPLARNTAFPAALASLLAAEEVEDTVMLLIPADHHLPDARAFRDAARAAAGIASEGHIVTFGITPDSPHTGYGYIKRGAPLAGDAARVAAFREKPDKATAASFLAEGGHYWNAGIFAAPAALMIAEMERHAPAVMAAARAAHAGMEADLDFLRLPEQALLACPDLSIDYAVMEHTEFAAVLPVDFAWSDLGSWTSVWAVRDQDEAGNVTRGDVFLHDSESSYIHSEGPVVAVSGLRDVVVVATGDAVLVTDRHRTESVKELLGQLKAADRVEASEHKKIFRPWGSYEQLALGPRFQVKRIIVNPGGLLSLQSHRHRAEHWVVVAGEAEVTVDEDVRRLCENQSIYVPLGAKHRLHNPTPDPLVLIEVQSGDYLGEDDIIRYDDVYARN